MIGNIYWVQDSHEAAADLVRFLHGVGLDTCFLSLSLHQSMWWGEDLRCGAGGGRGWPMFLVYKFNPIQNFNTP